MRRLPYLLGGIVWSSVEFPRRYAGVKFVQWILTLSKEDRAGNLLVSIAGL